MNIIVSEPYAIIIYSHDKPFRLFPSISVHEKIDQVAFHTCCPVGNVWARSRCEFTAERVSFGTSADRCLNDPEGSNSQMCDVSLEVVDLYVLS